MNQNKFDRLDDFNDIFIWYFNEWNLNFDYFYALHECIIIEEVKQDNSISKTTSIQMIYHIFKSQQMMNITIIYIMIKLIS